MSQKVENGQLAVKNIVLRDLEPLLRKTISDTLIVDSLTSKSLLSVGENYGSTILDVHAVIRRSKDADKEDLHLVAKMSPPTDFQKRIFDSPYTFRKEILMYTEILPTYNQLEIECGFKKDEVFDILPRFYGSRLSLDPKVDFDDDAVILLDNLKSQGYYTGDRREGCDYEHSKVVIHAISRFHALGIATKHRKPDCFKKLVEYSKSLQMDGKEFADVHKAILKKIEDNDAIKPYYNRCERALENLAVTDFWTATPEEPWSTIIHADFWVNNILFHRNPETDRVDDIKIIDFQNYLFLSPLRELIFFLFSSTNSNVLENHLDDLIDCYYKTLIKLIETMGCDSKLYSRESFNTQLPIDAHIEFMHLSFMLKVVTLDNTQSEFSFADIDKVMVSYNGNEHFVDRMRDLIIFFAKRDWI